MPQLKVQNFYSTALTSDIVGTGDTSFTVTVAPTFTSGFLVISPNNASLREIVYFHNVVGNTVSVRAENRGQGGTTARSHTSQEPVAMKDIAEIFNMFSDSISQCFFVEKTGGLTIKVWGGTVFYNGNPVTVADTILTLADNQTNYIKYDYPTNTISVDAINSGNIKARVTTVSGAITSIQYYVAKESYIDFTVTITGALPSQTGQAGKALSTDGTNVSWQSFMKPTGNGNDKILGTNATGVITEYVKGTADQVLLGDLSLASKASLMGVLSQTIQMGEAIPTPGYTSNIINAFATSGSNAGTYVNMGGRLQFQFRTKIISAKYPHNASNGSAAILITDVSGNTLGTYPVANGTKEATGINFVCEPGVIYQICCNSTANFSSLHANYTLTAADIAKGFISGCYANANFDTTWRMQEVVLQTEVPNNYPVAVVGNVTYVKSTPSTTSAGSVLNRGIVFNNAFAGRKLGVVKTFNNTNSVAGVITLQDSTGSIIQSRSLANGANSVDFNGTVIGTSYRLVVNDSVNWSSTSYYDTVATYQGSMPFIASGISAGVADNTNAFMFSEINIDYGSKGYIAKKSVVAAEFDFYLKFAGFVTGPKAYNDTVTVNTGKGLVVTGFSGLLERGLYFIGSSGELTISPTTDSYLIGKAISSTAIEIDTDMLKYTDATFNTIGSVYCGGYPYGPALTNIFKVLKKGTLRLTNQVGVNGGNVTGTRLTSVIRNGVSVYSSGGGAGSFDFTCDAGDVFIVTGYSFQEAGSGSLGGGSITLLLNDLTRTSKYITI